MSLSISPEGPLSIRPSPFHALGGESIISVTGNCISIQHLISKTSDYIHNVHGTAGIACTACLADKGLVAMSSRLTPDPNIYIYHKSKELQATLSGGTSIEYVDIAFDSTGSYLYSIGGFTDFRLFAWNLNVNTGDRNTSLFDWGPKGPPVLPCPCDWISVNPNSNIGIATGGSQGLFFWKLNKVDGSWSATMTPAEPNSDKENNNDFDDILRAKTGESFMKSAWDENDKLFAVSTAHGNIVEFNSATGARVSEVPSELLLKWGGVIDIVVNTKSIIILCGDGYVRWVERSQTGESFKSVLPVLSKVIQKVSLQSIGSKQKVVFPLVFKPRDVSPRQSTRNSVRKSPKSTRKSLKLKQGMPLVEANATLPPVEPISMQLDTSAGSYDNASVIVGDSRGGMYQFPIQVVTRDPDVTEDEENKRAEEKFGLVLCDPTYDTLCALLPMPRGPWVLAVGSKSLKVWNCNTRCQISKLQIISENEKSTVVTCADTLSVTSLTAVGLSNGTVAFIRAGLSGSLTVVGSKRRHTGSLVCMQFNPNPKTQLLATVDDNCICIIACGLSDSEGGEGGKLVGYLQLEEKLRGQVVSLCWQQNDMLLLLLCDGSVHQVNANIIEEYKERPIKMTMFGTKKSLGCIPSAIAADTIAYNSLLIGGFKDKSLQHLKGINWKQQSKPIVAEVAKDLLGSHQLGISTLAFYRSFVWGEEIPKDDAGKQIKRLVVTGGRDGAVVAWGLSPIIEDCINSSKTKGKEISSSLFQIHEGSVKHVVVSLDAKNVVSYGIDGTLFLWKLEGECATENNTFAVTLSEKAEKDLSAKQWTPKSVEIVNQTKLESKETEIQLIVAEEKRKLEAEASVVRKRRVADRKKVSKKLKELLKQNMTVSELEKLDRVEFCVDTKSRDLQILNNAEESATLRRTLEISQLRTSLWSSKIRSSTWDDMRINTRECHSFLDKLFVRDFPIRKLSAEKSRMQQIALRMRLIELREQRSNRMTNQFKWRGKINEIGKNCGYILNTGQLQPVPDGSFRGLDNTASIDENSDEWQGDSDDDVTSASAGLIVDKSTGETLGDLLYNPALIRTDRQKRLQVLLLQHLVVQQKEGFNAIFAVLAGKKESEKEKMLAKNARIKEILSELKQEDEYFVPYSVDGENPEETVLSVKDSEVGVEKYITVAQQALLDEAARLEALKKAQEGGMDAGSRALMDMMNGTLEKKKTLSAMEVQIVREAWMDEIAEEDLTDEQKKEIEKYDQRVKEAEHEKERYKKALGLECRKLKGEVLEIARNFDSELAKIKAKRLEVLALVKAEELYGCILSKDVSDKAEIEMKLLELNRRLEKKTLHLTEIRNKRNIVKSKSSALSAAVSQAKERDQALAYGFKHSIQDSSTTGIDHDTLKSLISLFKKRLQGEKKTSAITLRDALKPLHPERDIPESFVCEPEVWTTLNELRAEKIQSEWELKNAQFALSESEAALQRISEEETDTNHKLEEFKSIVETTRNKRDRDMKNVPIICQLVQGRIEISDKNKGRISTSNKIEGDSILLQSNVVEDLNKFIKSKAMDKVEIMENIGEFSKELSLLNWKEKWNSEQDKHLEAHYTDIHMLRVTKEMQDYIRHGTVVDQNKISMDTGKQRLLHMENMLKKKKRKISSEEKKLNNQIKKKKDENERLIKQGEDMMQTFTTRNRVFKSNNKNKATSSENNNRKMKGIVNRRKLMDLARAQKDETEFLKQELDKLRQRTFPSFAQSSQSMRRNPDEMF